MRLNRAFLGLESLEARNAPSTLNPVSASVPAHVSNIDHHHDDHHLHGNAQGRYTADRFVFDTGKSFHLNGLAHLDDRGEFHVVGSLHSVGFVASGQASGQLTLSNAHGSINIELTGPSQRGFSALPQEFHYQVVAATGAYAGLQAQGELNITHHAEHGGTAGSFQLHFKNR